MLHVAFFIDNPFLEISVTFVMVQLQGFIYFFLSFFLPLTRPVYVYLGISKVGKGPRAFRSMSPGKFALGAGFPGEQRG